MNKLCGERIATSLRYGFVKPRLFGRRLIDRRAIELLLMLVMLAAALAVMVALGDGEDRQEHRRENQRR